MKKLILALIIILAAGLFIACSKSGKEPEKKSVPKNAFTDYVDTGAGVIDMSKDLNKDMEKKIKKDEEMLLQDQ